MTHTSPHPKHSFKNDYSEGAHPAILARLLESNLEQQAGYGDDAYSGQAKARLKSLCACPSADIHFISGGTQANHLAAVAFLRPHEAVIAIASGHICVHEAGAIEATGHKVISITETADTPTGKLTPADIEAVLQTHGGDVHMVKPKLVYVSQSTELGSIYSRAELTALSDCCRAHDLYLYLDGARLGSALASEANDLSLAEIAKLTDAFYIGATKNGGLLGEAMIIVNPALQSDFTYLVKQRGALLAKGRLLGIQFEVLFASNSDSGDLQGDLQDTLFTQLAHHANAMTGRLATAMNDCGHRLWLPCVSNQLFAILPNALISELQADFEFYVWQRYDEGHSVVRLICSWATQSEQVDGFIQRLAILSE